jgi:putative colanic acid biosynthesis acetyltransferase WcaF
MWNLVYGVTFRPSPTICHAWRRYLLRLFGATIGDGCHIYPKARIWAPWNLICENVVTIANGAIVYNPKIVNLGSHSILSQESYLCGAGHDFNSADFPLIADGIAIGPYAWICARATVQMGVRVGAGAVLGLGGVATRDLEPWTVYGGVPARKIGTRVQPDRKIEQASSATA